MLKDEIHYKRMWPKVNDHADGQTITLEHIVKFCTGLDGEPICGRTLQPTLQGHVRHPEEKAAIACTCLYQLRLPLLENDQNSHQ